MSVFPGKKIKKRLHSLLKPAYMFNNKCHQRKNQTKIMTAAFN